MRQLARTQPGAARPAPLPEAAFQDRLLDYARLMGWRYAHFRPARTANGWRTPMQGDKGFPDLVLLRRERLLFVELKTAKGRLALEQQDWINDLRRAGAEAFVWRPEDWTTALEVLR